MMAAKKKISRRKFIVRTLVGGTGVLLGTIYLARNPLRRSVFELLDGTDTLSYTGDTSDPMLWFEITSENKVVLHSPKVEMGQGTFTSLVQIAADELELDLNQIQIVHAATATGNVDGLSTGGSTAVAGLWQPLRELSATLREMLKAEAAKKLGIDARNLQAKQGVISGGGKSITFGEVVQGVTQWEVPDVPPLKDIKDYRFVGQPIPRVDLVDKVMGASMFGLDASMPDMLYGSVVQPSKIGARRKSVNASKAEGMRGVVKVVQEDDFVGVVATAMMEAELAKQAIEVEWEVDRVWQTNDIEDAILIGKGEPMVFQKEGSAAEILDQAEAAGDANFISAEYKSPIGAHAQIEPNGAVAFVEDDKATVIISTQVVKITRSEVAKRLGMKDEQVNVIPTYLGGGFGRRLHTPHAMYAAVMSRAVGKPVKYIFSRKEEFQSDTFRPPTHHKVRAKLDANGMIEAIDHNFSSGDVMFGSPLFPGIMETLLKADVGAVKGGAIQYEKVPNYQAVSWRVKLPFATSWWRSLGLLANTFAVETFIDELAGKAGKDPVQYRLDQLAEDEKGTRLKNVIRRAAERSGYVNEAVNGRAMGIAASTDAGTPCAHVAEVSIVDGEIKVHKVTCVVDPGFAVNPDQVKAQCEGCIIMGMSASMFERMYVEDGELKPTIYGSYRMALMRDAPREIDIEIINGTGTPGAVGEPPMGPIAAAIANAAFRITGKRMRTLPLTLA